MEEKYSIFLTVRLFRSIIRSERRSRQVRRGRWRVRRGYAVERKPRRCSWRLQVGLAAESATIAETLPGWTGRAPLELLAKPAEIYDRHSPRRESARRFMGAGYNPLTSLRRRRGAEYERRASIAGTCRPRLFAGSYSRSLLRVVSAIVQEEERIAILHSETHRVASRVTRHTSQG